MFTEASSTSVPREIDTAELDARLNSAHPPIVAEILGPTAFSLGHLPSAINLPLEGFVENAPRAIPQRDAEVVVYCASSTCQNSDIAARKLQSLGYRNVRVYRGGKAAWKDAGLALAVT
jgi:rhodanese-related sulfurtransferase